MILAPDDCALARWGRDCFLGVQNRLRIGAGIHVPLSTRVYFSMTPLRGDCIGYASINSGYIVLDAWKLGLTEDQIPDERKRDFTIGLLCHEALHLVPQIEGRYRHHGKHFEELCVKACRAFPCWLPPISRHESPKTPGHVKGWPQGCGPSAVTLRRAPSPARPRSQPRPAPAARPWLPCSQQHALSTVCFSVLAVGAMVAA